MAEHVDFLRVKNWDRYQWHGQIYDRGGMPWFKFYNDISDDEAFFDLTQTHRLWVVSMWIVANKTRNRIPTGQPRFIQRYNLSDEPVNLAFLLREGWLIPTEDSPLPFKQETPANASKPFPVVARNGNPSVHATELSREELSKEEKSREQRKVQTVNQERATRRAA